MWQLTRGSVTEATKSGITLHENEITGRGPNSLFRTRCERNSSQTGYSPLLISLAVSQAAWTNFLAQIAPPESSLAQKRGESAEVSDTHKIYRRRANPDT